MNNEIITTVNCYQKIFIVPFFMHSFQLSLQPPSRTPWFINERPEKQAGQSRLNLFVASILSIVIFPSLSFSK